MLVDRFGRIHDYLRVSLTDRCNFSCRYCMPEKGLLDKERSDIMSFEEIETLVRLFVSLGVRKLRLTGGEPSIRKGYLDLVRRLAPLVPTHLTTNGAALSRHAKPLAEAGLAGINISLDSLRVEVFEEITQSRHFFDVLDGIEASLTAGLSIKINVVLMPGVNDGEILDFIEFVRERPIQVRFIEFMPFLGNQWKPEGVMTFAEVRSIIEEKHVIEPISGHASDVAKEFRIPGHAGSVGFVTSVSESFCGGCNRLRLTADGRFKTCLFLPPEASLRDMIRAGASEEEMVESIRRDLDGKWAGHPPMSRWRQLDTLSMVQIGG